MGTVTPHLSLYKPDPAELVKVAPQINQNYDKLDANSLSLSNRVGAVEGVAGLIPWQTFVPVIESFDNIAFVGGTERKGSCIKLGDLVYINVVLKGAISAPASIKSTATLKLSLPYAMHDAYIGQMTASADFAGTKMHFVFTPTVASVNRANFNPLKSSVTFVEIKEVLDVNWGSVTGYFVFNGWYRSTGVSLLTLTDEP